MEIFSSIKESLFSKGIKNLTKDPKFLWVSVGWRQKIGNNPQQLRAWACRSSPTTDFLAGKEKKKNQTTSTK